MPRTTLSPHPTSAAAARRFVADVLLNRGFAESCIEQAVLLASEAVTNAIVHARTDVDLVVVADHPMVRVEVHDGSPAPPRRLQGEADRTGGRGLGVMEALSEAWGVEELAGRGKCTWFEVRS